MVVGIVPEERCVNANERRWSPIVGAPYSSTKSTEPCLQSIGLYTHMYERSGKAETTLNGRQKDVRFTLVT